MKEFLSMIFWFALYIGILVLTSAEVTYVSGYDIYNYWPFTSDFMWFLWTIFQYTFLVVLISKVRSKILEPQKEEGRQKLYSYLTSRKKIIEEKMEKAKLEKIKVMPTPTRKDISVDASKFGGTPYWPQNIKYPFSHKGTPLICIAQLNLSDLPKNKILPQKGLLQFLVAADDYTLGDQGDFKVVYHEDISVVNTVKKLPISMPSIEFPIKGVFKLSFGNTKRVYPSSLNNMFDKILGKKLSDAYILEENSTIRSYFDTEYKVGIEDAGAESQVGGYPYPVQYDRFDADKYVLLFQMASYYKKGVNTKEYNIMWGDNGAAYFYILKEDLKKKDFSKVLYHWECY